jgi:hypothetical protein
MPSKTADPLRSAIAGGSYLEAERLLKTYRGEMQANWEAAVSPKQRRAIATEVGDLLEWARSATLAARSHAQGKLIRLSRRTAYTRTQPKPGQLELEA